MMPTCNSLASQVSDRIKRLGMVKLSDAASHTVREQRSLKGRSAGLWTVPLAWSNLQVTPAIAG
jgi:hypothetical protein